MGNDSDVKEPVSITKKIDVTIGVDGYDTTICYEHCRFMHDDDFTYDSVGTLLVLCRLFSNYLVRTSHDIGSCDTVFRTQRCEKCLEAFGK